MVGPKASLTAQCCKDVFSTKDKWWNDHRKSAGMCRSCGAPTNCGTSWEKSLGRCVRVPPLSGARVLHGTAPACVSASPRWKLELLLAHPVKQYSRSLNYMLLVCCASVCLTTVIQNRNNFPSKANPNEIFIVPAPAGCAAHNGRPGRRRSRSADGVRECVQLRTPTQPGA